MEMHMIIGLSLAHLTNDTRQEIFVNADTYPLTVALKRLEDGTTYGCFVHVPEKEFWHDGLSYEGVAPDLARCVEFAQENGADWLMFDEDVEPIPDLPIL